MRRTIALMMVVAALGLAAGCGGGDDGEVVEVDAANLQFGPADVTVPVGGTVRWTNTEDVARTVTKESGPGEEFDERLSPGDEVELTFEEAGRIEYVCTLHPGMTGTVTVE